MYFSLCQNIKLRLGVRCSPLLGKECIPLQKASTHELREELQQLIVNFESELDGCELRPKVLYLVSVLGKFRELGSSLLVAVAGSVTTSARTRILWYFQKHPLTVISGDELFVIAGIQEYARRVRELRVQFGWSIISGLTAREMSEEGEFAMEDLNAQDLRANHYVLLTEVQDTEAAYRWNVANDIRRSKDSVRNKMLRYLQHHVGKLVTGEELRYVANDSTEWARRVRELRTEHGWPIVTKNTGRPNSPVGTYLLESLRQSHEHDRTVSDHIRGRVLRRDEYRCAFCGWSQSIWNRSDPRHLELHHTISHAKGGENTQDNLLTLCTTCHDQIHRA